MGDEVTLIGSGPPREGMPYRFLHAGAAVRERFERFPRLPTLRSETAWEEASFVPGLLRRYRPVDYDVTLTCSYPFTNWALRRPTLGQRPRHVFVTQNGDWPAFSDQAEYRLFGCDGLVCINPDYLERNEERWNCALIPNGVDIARFSPGPPARERFGLPAGVPLVLMVSALIPSKNVGTGVEAVAAVPGAHLVVAGDGPLREEVRRQAEQLLPGRYHQLRVAPDAMPDLYRSADAFLHLSRDESFGNVYVEAMACGLPVVAYDLPRTRWIVGNAAFLAPDRGTAELIAALGRGLAAAGRCDAAVARAQDFSWRRVAGLYRDFLGQVVERGSAPHL